jgi:hypothetical protein
MQFGQTGLVINERLRHSSSSHMDVLVPDVDWTETHHVGIGECLVGQREASQQAIGNVYAGAAG